MKRTTLRLLAAITLAALGAGTALADEPKLEKVTIAQALKWRKPGDEIPGWKKSNSRRMIIWDEHRVHLAARKLEKAGEVEVKVSARFTRYKAVR